MVNFMAFISSFASYFFVFFVFVAAIIVAVILGIVFRKLTDKKKASNVDVQESTSSEN